MLSMPPQIASAAFPALMRLGSGGFASGYSSGLAQDDGSYGVVKAAGRKVSETSKVGGEVAGWWCGLA